MESDNVSAEITMAQKHPYEPKADYMFNMHRESNANSLNDENVRPSSPTDSLLRGQRMVSHIQRQAIHPDLQNPTRISAIQHQRMNNFDFNSQEIPGLSMNPGFTSKPPEDSPQNDKSAQWNQDGQVPEWAFQKTKAGKDRKRLPLACQSCRKKKIRCSGTKPVCESCKKSNLVCKYLSSQTRSSRSSWGQNPKSGTQRVEDENKRFSSGFDQLPSIPNGPPAEDPGYSRNFMPISSDNARKYSILSSNSDNLSRYSLSAHRTSQSFSSGADVFSQKFPPIFNASPKERTDRLPSVYEENRLQKPQQFQHLERIQPLHPLGKTIPLTRRDLLPPLELQIHLVQEFFRSIHGQTYYFLHEPSFMQQVVNEQADITLILSLCAVACRFSDKPSIQANPRWSAGNVFAERACRLLLEDFDRLTLSNVASCIALTLHYFGSCEGNKSWMLGGMATRMACAIQLNWEHPLYVTSTKSELSAQELREDELKRRLFFSCFILDRLNSSSAGRPVFFSEEECVVPLPIDEEMFLKGEFGATPNLSNEIPNQVPKQYMPRNPADNLGLMAYIVKVVALWGHVVRSISQRSADRKKVPFWMSDDLMQKLEHMISEFYDSLPSSYIYSRENLNEFNQKGMGAAYASLHIAYHEVLLYLHRWSIPLGPGKTPIDVSPQKLMVSKKIAARCANAIGSIIHDVLTLEITITVPFVGYSVFTAACIHLHGVFSSDPVIAHTCRCHFGSGLRLLIKYRAYWGLMENLCKTICSMWKAHLDVYQAMIIINRGQRPPDSFSISKDEWFPFKMRREKSDIRERPKKYPRLNHILSPQQTSDTNGTNGVNGMNNGTNGNESDSTESTTSNGSNTDGLPKIYESDPLSISEPNELPVGLMEEFGLSGPFLWGNTEEVQCT